MCGCGCRLWSTKQEQEKTLDEEATKRKQESADAKVSSHSQLHLRDGPIHRSVEL